MKTTLVSSLHGYSDYDLHGIPMIHRACTGFKMRQGDLFNVYCDHGIKLGAIWTGSLESSLTHFASTHPSYLAMVNNHKRTGFSPTPTIPSNWNPNYSKWRHGGWYVTNVLYPNGACGCVSNNYPDKRWRVVCDTRSELGASDDITFKSRDAAARAEYLHAQSE